jgi:WD40 repeat protein
MQISKVLLAIFLFTITLTPTIYAQTGKVSPEPILELVWCEGTVQYNTNIVWDQTGIRILTSGICYLPDRVFPEYIHVLWDANTEAELAEIKASEIIWNTDKSQFLAYRQYNSFLQKIPDKTNSIHLWDVAQAEIIHKFYFPIVFSATWMQDEKIIVAEAGGPTILKIWDTKTYDELLTLRLTSEPSAVSTFFLDPQNEDISYGMFWYQDGRIVKEVWDIQPQSPTFGQLLFTLPISPYKNYFGKSGYLFILHNNGTLELIDIRPNSSTLGKSILNFTYADQQTWENTFFSGDGQRLLTWSEALDRFYLWNTDEDDINFGTSIGDFEVETGWSCAWSMNFNDGCGSLWSNNRKLLVLNYANALAVYNTDETTLEFGKMLYTISFEHDIYNIDWSPQEDYLIIRASGSDDIIINSETGEIVFKIEYGIASFSSSEKYMGLIHYHGEYLDEDQTFTCIDATIMLYERPNFNLLGKIKVEDTCEYMRLAWSPDEEQVAVGSDSGKVYVWDIETIRASEDG